MLAREQLLVYYIVNKSHKICLLFMGLCINLFCFAQPTFRPDDLPGLSLWLIGDSTFTSNPPFIDTVYDNSANKYHAIQSNIDFRPSAVIESVLNNHKIIKLDGIDDFLKSDFEVTIGTIIIVSNWSGGDTVFPANFELLSKNYSDDPTSPWSILEPWGGSSQWASSSYIIINDFYRNSISSNSYSPLSDFKITAGNTASPVTLNNIMLGWVGASARFWNGNIVEVIFYDAILSNYDRQQVEQYLNNKYAPPVDLGQDKNVYGFCPTTLNAQKDWFKNYLWSSNGTLETISVTSSGSYSVSATNIFGYLSHDTINILYPNSLRPFSDTSICLGDTIKWDTGLDGAGYDFFWQDGISSDSIFYITQPGQYYVKITDTIGCFRYSDTLTVVVDPFPVLNLLPDTISMCKNNIISTLIPASTLIWSTNDTTSSINIDSTSLYSVTATNINGCVSFDSVFVNINGVAPTAAFSVIDVCFGKNTMYVDTSKSQDSSSIITWLWNFGDSTSDSTQNPVHLFSQPGNFNVTLTVQTDSGCSNSITKNVVVHSLPAADFNSSGQPFCSADTVNLMDISSAADGAIINWAWNFDDPASGLNNTSSLPSPVHLFSDSGIFQVFLAIEDTFGCRDSATMNITIYPIPAAAFNVLQACENTPVKFFDNSQGIITGWDWDFGDNNNSGEINPENIYSVADTYLVSLEVTTIIGCRNMYSDTVFVYHNPVAYFNDTDFCRTVPVQVFDQSNVAGSNVSYWEWDVLSHSNYSSQQHPYFNFSASDDDSYLLKLKVKSVQGCTDSIIRPIYLHNPPMADFTSSTTYGEIPLTINFTNNSSDSSSVYYWSFGNNDSSVLVNPSYTYNDSGNYQVMLIAYDKYGCPDTLIKTLKVREPVNDIAVTKVFTSTSGNYLTVSASLYNLGNTAINFFEIFTELEGRPAVKESWSGLLDEKDEIIYTFNAAFEVSGNTMPDAICVKVANPNPGPDADTSNNEACISFSEFKILTIYPNPAMNEIIIEYTLNGEASNQEIFIYDELGKKVKEYRLDNNKKGLYKVRLDIDGFNKGIYALKLVYGDQYEIKKFMKF